MGKNILICQFRNGMLEVQEQRAYLRRLHARPNEVTFLNAQTHATYPTLTSIRGIILGGSGDNTLTRTDYPWFDRLKTYTLEAIDRDIPILGICFGHQFLARIFGASVISDPQQKEIGVTDVQVNTDGRHDELLRGLQFTFSTMMAHNDSVVDAPRSFVILAWNRRCPIEAFRVRGKRVWGVQFHPELVPADYKARLDYYRDYYVDAGIDIEALYRLGERPTNDEILLTNFYAITQASAVV